MTENKIMPKVFGWMFTGLMLTFLTGYFISTREFTATKLLSGATPLVFAIVEIILVIFLAARVFKMNPTTAKVTFLIYSVVSGITFSGIFIYYDLSSIIYVFLITAALFGIFAFAGFVTKMDLTKIGTYFIIGLFGIILCTIVNIFLQNDTFDLIISIVGVVLFIGLTAYDVQKIKHMAESGMVPIENLPIYGALQLYLDFINIFIKLLQIFGKRND